MGLGTDVCVPGQNGGWLTRCLAGWLTSWISGWVDGWLSRKSAGGNNRLEDWWLKRI
jgi:uncharacterized membrane protein YeaQ/YmgE (transglycosylase-associated protein family)